MPAQRVGYEDGAEAQEGQKELGARVGDEAQQNHHREDAEDRQVRQVRVESILTLNHSGSSRSRRERI